MIVQLPYMYVPDPTRGRPVFDGKIYIGNPDTNPRLPENQKSALLVQEDGSVVEAAYPIATNSGGVPTYDGSPVAIDVVGEYSLAIDDRNDNQVYYFPNAGSILEFITTDLRSIMFDLCLEYDDIGTAIVTDVEGTDLDDAEWILDIETGAVWRVPPDVPAGSTVVSLVDNILTTNNGQFTVTVTKCPIAPNKIKTAQFVVEGTTGDPLPSTTATSYLATAEMAFGWVVTTDVVDAVIDANGNLTATSGVVEYTFDKADNETPNAASLFASVMRCTDAANSVYVQDYADGSNGISLVNETATTITLRIDFSSFAGGKVFGTSEQPGRLPILSTYQVLKESEGAIYIDVNGGSDITTNYTELFDISTILGSEFSGKSLNLEAQVFNDSGSGIADWGRTGWYHALGIGSYGVQASIVGDDIVVQSANAAVLGNANLTGNGFGNTSTLTTALCRVKVWL